MEGAPGRAEPAAPRGAQEKSSQPARNIKGDAERCVCANTGRATREMPVSDAVLQPLFCRPLTPPGPNQSPPGTPLCFTKPGIKHAAQGVEERFSLGMSRRAAAALPRLMLEMLALRWHWETSLLLHRSAPGAAALGGREGNLPSRTQTGKPGVSKKHKSDL